MRFFLYGNSGGIYRVKDELANPKETFATIREACMAVVERNHDMFDIEDLFIKYYGYDERIEKDVYMITTSCYGDEDYIKEYGYPQFVSYMVSV